MPENTAISASEHARRYDIDALRVFAFGLLILYHVGMFYVADWGWHVKSNYQAEWLQFFNDAWFMHREQFFDADMRGLDWVAVRDKYTPLVKRVTERRELNDVLGQMMGELNTLHSAVRGGDFPSDPNAPSPAVLGAELKQTKRGVEITHIYRLSIALYIKG